MTLTAAVSGLARAQSAPTAPAPLPADSVEIGRKYVQWFYTNQADSLFAHMPPEGQQHMGSSASIGEGILSFSARAGTEVELVEERWVRRNGRRQYWRVARFSDFAQEPLMLRIVILPDGSLGGIGMNPASQPPPVDPEP
ncbi:MAG: hypothetical protein HYR48_08265 [Gemmatimonadetes bacterium]|nr:hypothetical protein [Gemmatimonadota bacterium]